MTIYLVCKAQIMLLLAKKVTVPAEYNDFADVFSKKSAEVLSMRTSINKYTIKLINGKHLLYRPIYSLGPVKLKTLTSYIETKLANDFI